MTPPLLSPLTGWGWQGPSLELGSCSHVMGGIWTQTDAEELRLLLLSHVQLFVTPWTVAPRLLCLWDSPGKNTGVGCHFLLQGIFLAQEWNPHLLHWRVDSLLLSHWEPQGTQEGQQIGSKPTIDRETMFLKRTPITESSFGVWLRLSSSQTVSVCASICSVAPLSTLSHQRLRLLFFPLKALSLSPFPLPSFCLPSFFSPLLAISFSLFPPF